jgi:hypothetical protein
MVRKLRMWEMTSDSVPEGTMMVSEEAMTPNEVQDHLKDTMDHSTGQAMYLVIAYLVLGHPPMHPNMGFIELVSGVTTTLPADSTLDLIMVVHNPIYVQASDPPLEDAGGRAKNHATGEAVKTRKDHETERKRKRLLKWQGDGGEDDRDDDNGDGDEEKAISSILAFDWDDLE